MKSIQALIVVVIFFAFLVGGIVGMEGTLYYKDHPECQKSEIPIYTFWGWHCVKGSQ